MAVRVKIGTESEVSPGKERGVSLAEGEKVELDGRKKFFALRTTWSHWIIGWITALVAFNVLLTAFVGFGWLDFSEYEWFVTAVTIETFLQIIGLGVIAVKYLFSD